jgi:hypothetical protein
MPYYVGDVKLRIVLNGADEKIAMERVKGAVSRMSQSSMMYSEFAIDKMTELVPKPDTDPSPGTDT